MFGPKRMLAMKRHSGIQLTFPYGTRQESPCAIHCCEVLCVKLIVKVHGNLKHSDHAGMRPLSLIPKRVHLQKAAFNLLNKRTSTCYSNFQAQGLLLLRGIRVN